MGNRAKFYSLNPLYIQYLANINRRNLKISPLATFISLTQSTPSTLHHPKGLLTPVSMLADTDLLSCKTPSAKF